jgi:hypothetical protein
MSVAILPGEGPRAAIAATVDRLPVDRVARQLTCRLLAEAGRSLRAHSIFIAIVVAYLAAAYAAPRLIEAPAPFSIALYSNAFAVLAATLLLALAAIYVVRVMLVVRPQHLARYLWDDLGARYVTSERVCSALPVFLLLPAATAAFSYWKSLIPAIAPYSWDPFLAEWDQVVHGGHQPWELLQLVFGHVYVSFAINVGYNVWFLVLYGVILWQTFSVARPRLRMRYLLTLLIVWIILGNVAATLLASGGPVFYGRLTGLPDPFAPLMDYLRAANDIVPIWAVTTQDYIWDLYVQGTFDIGAGISAMPSIHVASAFSFALLGFATNRRLGIMFLSYVGLVLIGSVHLGWHYAIDGYIAIATTWLIWAGLGWLLDRPAIARLLWGARANCADVRTLRRPAPRVVASSQS